MTAPGSAIPRQLLSGAIVAIAQAAGRMDAARRATPGGSPSTALERSFGALLGIALSLATLPAAQAGDLLRGGAAAGAAPTRRGSESKVDALAGKVSGNANDVLARTTEALNSARALQEAAHRAARQRTTGAVTFQGQALSAVPNGLRAGGLEIDPDVAANPGLWKGARLPFEAGKGPGTRVIIQQREQTAVLNWKTFNVGKDTTVEFSQGGGGERKAEWIAFNKINDPAGRPSQILGSIKADGQVYLINRNGIIFGGSSQIDVHTLVASTLPINDNLVKQGLLNNRDAQFLFSALPVPGGSDGTPAFNPTINDPEFQVAVGADTYVTREPLAVTGANAPLQAPQFTYRTAGGARVALQSGTDYTVTVDAGTKKASTVFTPAGLAKVAGVPVRVTYAPAEVKSADLVIQAGAKMVSPANADGSGGRLMFVGPNVTNSGDLSTPSGQTILAAGQQVGVAAHASADPSLRGLDVFVGAARESTGTAANYGVIESLRGSVTMTGRHVDQMGVIDSSTTVDLNGRIDLLASYGAVANPLFDNGGQGSSNPFVHQHTGVVTLGEGSTTRILPDYASDKTVPGTSLPQKSQINIDGQAVHFRANALMVAPNADVQVRAGGFSYKDLDGDRTTLYVPDAAKPTDFKEEPGLQQDFTGSSQRFFFSGGQIYLDQSSLLSVAGSADVFVPIANSILEVSFRGSELADSPLQRSGVLRNVPLTVDLRRSGAYNGRYWIGTPLGDATGLAGLIQRNVAQLTADGGNVTLRSGGSIVVENGATIDVSGGFFRHEAGLVKTTRLMQNGRLLDIADAVPDQVYDGVFTGTFTTAPNRWGITETFNIPLIRGEHWEPSYLEGANGGTLAMTAPSMAIDGQLLGWTIEGARQRSLPPELSSVSFSFTGEKILVDPAGLRNFLSYSPTPPGIIFSHGGPQGSTPEFQLTGDTPAALPPDRIANVAISTRLLDEDGFGHLTIENPDGKITLPSDVSLTAPALGSITVSGANIDILGTASAPGGELTFTAFGISPTFAAEFPLVNIGGALAPLPDLGRGHFTLGPVASLSTAGLIIDDRVTTAAPLEQPLAIDGGDVSITAYSADLQRGGSIDVSGGVRLSPRGAATYGNGGSIRIVTGKDPSMSTVLGGELVLDSTLAGYSGATGGSLSIRTTAIQIGGPLAAHTTPVLFLQPDFFRHGGFTSYTLEGVGAPPEAGKLDDGYVPAIAIAPGTRIEPLAESWLVIPHPPGSQAPVLQRIVKDPGQRKAASISFAALGADDPFTIEDLEVRGDIVMGEGASIVTDPGASVTFKGDTVSVLGTITTPGGAISITGAKTFPLRGTAANSALFGLPTVYLGPNARLSAAGTAVMVPDVFGRRVGTLYSGGSISVFGNIVADRGAVLDVSGAAAVFDVAPESLLGSTLTGVPVTSGINAPLWSGRGVPVRFDSDGGYIDLQGSEMLYTDATLLGRAGGPTAVGGSLSIFSGRFHQIGALQTGEDINLVVTQSGNVIPTEYKVRGVGLRVGNETGVGYFSADRFSAGGFDSLDLGAKYLEEGADIPFGGNVEFRGRVSITAPGMLRVAGGGIIKADAPVSLNAAYVSIGQPFRTPLNPDDPALLPFEQTGGGTTSRQHPVVPTFGPGSLTVNAKFIDTGTLSLQNIGSAHLNADGGDVRGNGTLDIAGNLTIRAGQLYPTTAGEFTIAAYDQTVTVAASTAGNAQVTLASPELPYGFRVGSPLLGSTVASIAGTTVTLASGAAATITTATPVPFALGSVTIRSSGTPAAPLSAGGKLSIFASNIFQGGTVLAPFGSILLGWDGTDFDPSTVAFDQPTDLITQGAAAIPTTRAIALRSGSLTSVAGIDFRSNAELLVPYGLSPDGLTWIDPTGVNVTLSGLTAKTLSLAGDAVSTAKGSTIDIRGGGDLYAYRWVQGIGGSTDLLGEASATWNSGSTYKAGDLVSFGGKTWSARVEHSGHTPSVSLYWSLVPESYAVIPGFASAIAPYAPHSTSSNAIELGGDMGYVSGTLQIGDRIRLNATPELDAGYYTLLPRRYALLPGAFLVTPTNQNGRSTFTLPDESTRVAGTTFNALSNPQRLTKVQTQFEVLPSAITRDRVEYEDYLGNSFLRLAAEASGLDQSQELPIDAGYLSFQGNSGLRPEGNVLTGRPHGGRGASIDLSSFGEIYVVGGSGAPPPGAKVVLKTSVLESWGAESLLIGGLRRAGPDGTLVDVRAKKIVLDNSGDVFHAPEIILAANEDLTLAPGAALAQKHNLSRPGATLLPTGTFRLGASGDSLAFASGGSPIKFPNGTPGDNRITTSVSATITRADGTTLALAANVPVTLAAGSTITLSAPGSIAFASGSGGPIPLAMGDGVLLRVTGDLDAAVVRSGLNTATAPTLTLGAGSHVAGANVIVDSTYGSVLDPAADIRAKYLTLGGGQISVVLEPTGVLTGSVVTPHLVLAGQVLEDVQKVKGLTLTSYRTIDFYGAGTFGEGLGSLSLLAGGIRGYNQAGGSVVLKANSVLFDNPTNVAALAPPAGPLTGAFAADLGTLRFGSNAFSITGYSDVSLTASNGVTSKGTGSFTTPGNLTITTPLITGARNSAHSISADGDLVLEAAPGGSKAGGGLGVSYTFSGSSVVANTRILLPSGQLTLRATGTGADDDVTVGGVLDVSGTAREFYDLMRFTNAGEITLTSASGDVTLSPGSTVSVAAAAAGGSAGTVRISAAKGAFTSTGAALLGGAADGQTTGSFVLDVGTLASFSDLGAGLNDGGFFEQRNLRIRTGDITIADVSGQPQVARNFALTTDQGSITVTGTIDASGRTGGEISLVAGGSLTLESGAVLTAHGEEFGSAGKGGSIRLEAGAAFDGTPNLAALLDIKSGATIDLGVTAYATDGDADILNDYLTPGTSAFYGQFQGTLHLRAPRNGNDVNVNALQGTITGASSVLVEAYRIYEPAGGTLNRALRDLMNADNAAFMNAGYAAMEGKLLTGSTLDPNALVIAPGVEIINKTGNLTLGAANNTSGGSTDIEARTTADWDLSSFRYGPKGAAGVLTLRAAGDLIFNNTLSDGFTPVTGSGVNGHSTMWLAPLAVIDQTLPTNTQSWSYRLAAGADLQAANFQSVAPGSGSLLLGEFYPEVPNSSNAGTFAAVGANGLTAGSIRISTTNINTDRGTRFEVIRTGAGDIDIATGGDVQLRNQFATIYTAGVRLPTPTTVFAANDFVVPIVNRSTTQQPPSGDLGAIQQGYNPQWSMAGGDVTIAAAGDIGRFTLQNGKVVADASRQLPNNWLYRRGFVDSGSGLFAVGGVTGTSAINTITDAAASTTWWIDFSNFFEGFGALGGGDISLLAGRDLVNADAVIPTNARMPGRDATTGLNVAPDPAKLVELGGGDLLLRAGRNIDGGAFYVERGSGRLSAGAALTTNAARTPSVGILADGADVVSDPLTWLPVTLFAGKTQFDVSARGDVLLGPVTNPFLLPQGLNNKFWYKTYFNTFAEDAAISVSSFGGSVTHRLAATPTGGQSALPILRAWYESQYALLPTSSAYYQPWLRSAEANFTRFSTLFTVSVPTIRSTAFAGDVNIVGPLTLFPSPSGTLELAASGAVNGLQPAGRGITTTSLPVTVWTAATINVSDANPALVPSVTAPLAYSTLTGRDLFSSRASDAVIFATVDPLFQETGSFTGPAGAFTVQQALHASSILHAEDPEPVRIYAGGGDITGLTFFSPKQARLVAQNDISDVALYIQNAAASEVSIVSAGRDIIPFSENTPLRSVATDLSRGNVVGDPVRGAVTGVQTNAAAGDIQINGPGAIEILAGRDVDLGTGANFLDGTGVGITSVGPARNPYLPFGGASIIVLAGVGGVDRNSPAFGLTESSLELESFDTDKIGATVDSYYLEQLGVAAQSGELTPEQKAIVALEIFFNTLRDSGRAAAESGDYSAGFAAIEALFGSKTADGEISTRARDIRTSAGGSISLLAPGGGVTMASDIFGNPLTPPGIVTEFGGPISVFTDASVDIGQARIFTLRGGDIVMWSSHGDIAAGNAPRTVATAPPTRVVIDATSANVQTDLGGLATGGGIGVLASVQGVPPGNVDLIAPGGVVDAGDAGIRSTGNLTIAATAVLNAGNIQVGGSSAGVPSVAPPAAPALSAPPPPPPPANTASPTQQDEERRREQAQDDSPSIIEVELLGFGDV